MKIFFDTEFQERDYRCIEFISLGMVREDGEVLYGISHELSWSLSLNRLRIGQTLCSDWVTDNVGRHLKDTTKPLISLHEITEFCGDSPEFWADWGAYDWVVLCQLFGTMMDLPKGWPMFVRDFQQLLDDVMISIDGNHYDRTSGRHHLEAAGPQQDPATLHHALHDARHLKAQYDFIQSQL